MVVIPDQNVSTGSHNVHLERYGYGSFWLLESGLTCVQTCGKHGLRKQRRVTGVWVNDLKLKNQLDVVPPGRS